MNSRTVGFFLPLARTTQSRMACRPEIADISSSVNASSMPLVEKSKLSASDKSESASISSGSLSMRAHLSSASILRSGHGGDQMRDLDVFGIVPAAGHLSLEPRIIALGRADVRVDHEDELAPLRSEALAAAALAGLDDHRTALGGPRHGERPARAEKTPVVVEAMHLLRMGEPLALSCAIASTSQLSQWPNTTSMNSSARS